MEKIISEWQQKNFKPVYWFEGEESFFIDHLIGFAEEKILTPQEAPFNQTILYGKDSDWQMVANACMRYPVFAEKQVVIVKEAQQIKDIEKLASYISKPLQSTVLIVGYKGGKIDSRTVFGKLLKAKTELYTTKKLYDNQLPAWVESMVNSKGLNINRKAREMLIDHVGNDLSRLVNEVNKITLNLKGKEITENEVEEFVGISKEFNVFELQDALAHRNLAKALRIIQYFGANPKAGSIHYLMPVLYGFFSKLYAISIESANREKDIYATFRNPAAADGAKQALKNYGTTGLEKIILILQQYNLKSLGVDQGTTPESALLSEMVGKIILAC